MKDRFSPWTAFVDMLITALVCLLTMVAPRNPEDAGGPRQKAEFLVSVDWDVEIDADVDLWLIPPSRKPVFYAAREVGCAALDRDSRGFLDNLVTLADGTRVKVESAKETVSVRCIEPGRYDIGVHLYAYHAQGQPDAISPNSLALKAHVEIVRLNPTLEIEYAGDVVFNRSRQTINVVSFDLQPNGDLSLVDPPLEKVTAAVYGNKQAPE